MTKFRENWSWLALPLILFILFGLPQIARSCSQNIQPVDTTGKEEIKELRAELKALKEKVSKLEAEKESRTKWSRDY